MGSANFALTELIASSTCRRSAVSLPVFRNCIIEPNQLEQALPSRSHLHRQFKSAVVRLGGLGRRYVLVAFDDHPVGLLSHADGSGLLPEASSQSSPPFPGKRSASPWRWTSAGTRQHVTISLTAKTNPLTHGPSRPAAAILQIHFVLKISGCGAERCLGQQF